MKITIAFIILSFAVIRTWIKFAKDSEEKGKNTIGQLVVAITTTWAFYEVASQHIQID